jgi:Icc-related predicted phosphoesterase
MVNFLLQVVAFAVICWSQQCVNVYHEGAFLGYYQKTFGIDRVVLVGDLHSDYSALQKIVFYTNITKQDTFIALGDVLGYGNDTKDVLRFFQKVPNAFHIVGNEEIYSLLKIGQEIGKGDVDSFGGYPARIKAFSKGGEFWDYLTTRPLVLKFGDFLVTHAGLSLSLALNYSNVEDLNKDFISNKDLTGPFGPAHYSNYADWPENATCSSLYETLEKTNTKFMIMSHTWFPTITTRCRGRGIFLHTGISQSFNSSLSALEVLQSEGKTLYQRALYPKHSETLYSTKVY